MENQNFRSEYGHRLFFAVFSDFRDFHDFQFREETAAGIMWHQWMDVFKLCPTAKVVLCDS
jgi:ABC-type siderophore export system fused ATPase/permease subunit